MKNLFTINFAEKSIVASKTTLKKASIPNSPEYKALMKLMKQNPTFAIAEKDIKQKEGKITYKGLTANFIEKYISIQANAEDLKKQFEQASKMGKFPLVRKWILETFENFKREEAEGEITKANLDAIFAVSANSKCEIIEMPVAQNH